MDLIPNAEYIFRSEDPLSHTLLLDRVFRDERGVYYVLFFFYNASGYGLLMRRFAFFFFHEKNRVYFEDIGL